MSFRQKTTLIIRLTYNPNLLVTIDLPMYTDEEYTTMFSLDIYRPASSLCIFCL